MRTAIEEMRSHLRGLLCHQHRTAWPSIRQVDDRGDHRLYEFSYELRMRLVVIWGFLASYPLGRLRIRQTLPAAIIAESTPKASNTRRIDPPTLKRTSVNGTCRNRMHSPFERRACPMLAKASIDTTKATVNTMNSVDAILRALMAWHIKSSLSFQTQHFTLNQDFSPVIVG